MSLRAVTLLTLVFICMSCFAQIPPARPTTNNRVVLTVRVRLPNGRPVSIPAEVQVVSSLGAALTENFTHDDGLVELADVPPGTYRLKVSGIGIETTVGEPFDIGDNDRTHFETVTVRVNSTNTTPLAPPIRSQDFTVPAKAQEEMEKGMDAFAKGETKEAALHIQQAIQIFPRFALAYYNLGVIFASQGDRPAAENAFEKSVESDEHFVPGFIRLAQLRRSDQVQASALLAKALAIDPNNVEALALLARLQFDKGDFDSSLATVQKVHALPHEHFADVHLISAEIYQKQNRNAEALAESELYLKEFPESPRAQQVKAAMEQIKARK